MGENYYEIEVKVTHTESFGVEAESVSKARARAIRMVKDDIAQDNIPIESFTSETEIRE